MFQISLPSPSNTIRGQAGQCDWHFFVCPDVFPKSPHHICCAVLFLGSSSWLISSVPFQLNASCPCILSTLDTAQEYFPSHFQLWNQFQILLFFLSTFSTSTSEAQVDCNVWPRYELLDILPVPIPHSSFLASYSIPHFKKAPLSCSVLLLITAVVAYFATSITCSLGISNDSNYSSLCGQSLSAFSYYPQATSSAVSYSSIKIRNWVLFLSPVPSPCSLQQAVNTSDF